MEYGAITVNFVSIIVVSAVHKNHENKVNTVEFYIPYRENRSFIKLEK